MKKVTFLITLFCSISLVLILSSTSFAKNPDIAPEVSIDSPVDHAVIIGNSLDAEV